ncbi:MAG TPA: hypothetical protein VFU49_08620, partial [Ktedonobacteraceae bacterium]|nr:hypothetical protein [Ktedonobacteraceae bacterium]
HTVAILFAGDTPPPIKLPGVSIHHLGGTDTWQRLTDAYNKSTTDADTTGQTTAEAVGFRL